MAQAFVLGNGVSRQGVDLHKLQEHGKIYGCNALYRDFTPDVLVATDKPIREQIQNSGYALTHKFYTRQAIEGQGATEIPSPFWKYSSGPIALALAAKDNHKVVWMLGFDMGPDLDNRFNNVYAGTEFYKAAGAVPTYTLNWVQQVIEVCKKYPNTEFKRVCGPTTASIKDFESVANLKSIAISDFKQQVNC